MNKWLVFVALVSVSLVGCGSNPAVGTWKGSQAGITASITINADKTFEAKVGDAKEASLSGTWEAKDKEISLNATKAGGIELPKEAQKPQTATLSDDGKSITMDGVSLTKQ